MNELVPSRELINWSVDSALAMVGADALRVCTYSCKLTTKKRGCEDTNETKSLRVGKVRGICLERKSEI